MNKRDSNLPRGSIQGGLNIGLGTLLTIIFLILKLCNVIDWNWIYIFLPVIISVSLDLIILIVALIIYCVYKSKE